MAPQSLTCAICGKLFKKHSYLQDHMRIHSGVRPYKCLLCDKDFLLKYQAKRHMMSHTQNTVAHIKCADENCPRRFKLERTMRRHYESAHALHKCTYDGCELAFRKKQQLKAHLEMHNPITLKCPYEGCSSVFCNKRNLERHMECHEKVFKCKILGCGVSVKSWLEYRKHVKSHKIVSCKECDTVCPDVAAFKKHFKQMHTKPKEPKPPKKPKEPKVPVQVVCHYEGCGKTYSKGSNLNKHIRVVHNGVKFHCPVEGCDKKYSYRSCLKEHLASHEVKKTKKKRKRKSLAAKLSRYNGELCDLPVTYVDPNEEDSSESVKEPDESASSPTYMTSLTKGTPDTTLDTSEEKILNLSYLSDSSTSFFPLTVDDSQSNVLCSSGMTSFGVSLNEHTQLLDCPS